MSSNVVQLAPRRPKAASSSRTACPVDARTEKQLGALKEVQRLCELALLAGGLGGVQGLETDLMIAVHDAFKGTDWKARFERTSRA